MNRSQSFDSPWRLALAGLCIFLSTCASPQQQPPRPPRPLIVIGIDGGEWTVIRQLWKEGRLPHLAAIAERGVTADLRTRYTASPVIWTTIATGKTPQEHGITDFVVPTPDGDVPVSSTVRRVPAIWKMASAAGRKVAVLGWWASWPAEEIHGGVVVSDRALLDVEQRFSPPSFGDELRELRARAELEENAFFSGNDASRARDHLMAYLGRRLVERDYDLLLVYFRGVDIASHIHWKHYRPDAFVEDRPSEEEIEAFGEIIPREYEAVDEAIGRILAAAPEPVNLVVISDHGFQPAQREIIKVGLDFDDLLQRLGYLGRRDGAVDFGRSRLYTYSSPRYRNTKWVRYCLAGREPGGTVESANRQEIRARLEKDLGRITYGSQAPAFAVEPATPKERQQGADFVVRVQSELADTRLLLDGDPAPLAGLIHQVARSSGTHGENTHGILLAAGPDIDPGARLEGIGIHDVTPTLLYGLGLPVAEDFAGRAFTELFDNEFRADHPLRTIATWGTGGESLVTPSGEDEALIRELRALGYLD